MYDPRVNGKRLTFGISGLLYQSTVLFYDRESHSLWSQLGARAVSGSHAGTPLRKTAFADTTWGDWKRRHPSTLVLSRATGHARNYGGDPYARYRYALAREGPMFPVNHGDGRLPPNAIVFGIEVNGRTKAFAAASLETAPARFTSTVGTETLTLVNDPPGTLREVRTADGRPVPATRVLWFAWVAFHPETELYAGAASGAASGEAARTP